MERKSEKMGMLTALKKHWHICAVYIVSSYILTWAVIDGSKRIATVTDELFTGKNIILKEMLLPFLALMLLGTAAAFFKSLSKNTFSINMQTDIRNMLMGKLVKLPYSYFDREGTGTLTNKLISDIYQIESLFAEILPEGIVGIITIIAVCAGIYFIDIRLLAVTVLSYPVLIWLANVLTKRLTSVGTKRRDLYDELENVALDAYQGIAVGKSFNLYEVQKKRIYRVIDAILTNEYIRTKIIAAAGVFGNVISWIPTIICYLFSLYEVWKGNMTLGEFMAYIMLFDRLNRPLSSIPHYIASLRESMVSVKRLQIILNEPEEPSGWYMGQDEAVAGEEAARKDKAVAWQDKVVAGEETAGQDEAVAGEETAGQTRTPKAANDSAYPVMELKNIHFSYESSEREVLSDFNFSINAGENVAFVGSSGSGKSTLIRIMCGFYRPKSGKYIIYGHDYDEWNVEALRRRIALVSQNVFLFPVTIAENVAYGRLGATMDEIVEACKNANIHDFIMQLADGYNTLAGERGARFSGGQKQRLSIARAFLKDAPIILLDEPTSAVDVENEHIIQEAVRRISKGRTVITVAHRLSTIVNADKIYVIDDGKIAESGTHQELVALKGTYSSLYEKEIRQDMEEKQMGGGSNGI